MALVRSLLAMIALFCFALSAVADPGMTAEEFSRLEMPRARERLQMPTGAWSSTAAGSQSQTRTPVSSDSRAKVLQLCSRYHHCTSSRADLAHTDNLIDHLQVLVMKRVYSIRGEKELAELLQLYTEKSTIKADIRELRILHDAQNRTLQLCRKYEHCSSDISDLSHINGLIEYLKPMVDNGLEQMREEKGSTKLIQLDDEIKSIEHDISELRSLSDPQTTTRRLMNVRFLPNGYKLPNYRDTSPLSENEQIRQMLLNRASKNSLQ